MKRKELPCSDSNVCEEGATSLVTSSILKKARTEQNTNMNKKSDKYDRQLRLWGENGQQCLENAHVVLLNVTATGTEILKCLILPGIGRFSIVDGGVVTINDISSNFFLSSEALGKSKAKVSCELLQELNEDTVGSYQFIEPIELIERDPAFFKSASIVVASRLNQHDLCRVSNFLWSHNIPLVICETYAAFGFLSISLKEHVIIEAHPDNALEDLRLDNPFDSLQRYMDAIDLKSMNKLEHSHTPFLVILYKYLQEWKQTTGQVWPKNFKEKKEIREMISNGMFKNDDIAEIEENFDEAIKNVNNSFVKTSIPSDVAAILNDPMTEHPLNTEENAVFWILARSLREFVKDNQSLPLRGNLPDMFADSKRYIELQTIYKEKADEDIKNVYKYVKEALLELQLPNSFISEEQCKLFCKNSAFLKVIRGSNIIDLMKDNEKFSGLLNSLEENHAAIILLLHAIRNAGIDDSKHFDKLANLINQLRCSLKFESDVASKYAAEVNRCNFKEIHCIAAIMGGIAAQEVIKIIAKQFVPCENIFVYDGTNSSTSCGKLV